MTTKEHEALKETAKQILTKMGFRETEIQTEYYVTVQGGGLKSFKVDVVGLNENRKVAIECGETLGTKIAALKMFFDDVIVLPFFTVTLEDDTAAKTIVSLNQKITNLQIQLKEEIARQQEQAIFFEATKQYFELLNLACIEGKISKEKIKDLKDILERIEKTDAMV